MNKFKCVAGIALLIRIILIIFSLLQDKISTVKYTDIDYDVFSRAGSTLMTSAGTTRLYSHNPTYRYPPVIAYLFKLEHIYPSIPCICKMIFSLCDILTAYVLMQLWPLAQANGLCAISYLWLFNPLVISISTRGNFDGGLCCALAWSLYYLCRGPNAYWSLVFSAFLYGITIYLRLFPIILAPCYFVALSLQHYSNSIPDTIPIHFVKIYYDLFRIRFAHFVFGLTTLITVSSLVGFSYLKFGWPYLDASLLYHIRRADFRHNFSPHFYPTYLQHSKTWQALEFPLSALTLVPISLLAFLIPFLIIASSRNRLPTKPDIIRLTSIAMFCTSLVFVTFNKVFTSQYFTWPLVYAPITFGLHFSKHEPLYPVGIGPFKWSSLYILLGLWCISKGIWLFTAYLLEFCGINTFLPLWISSLLFFASNISLICYALRFS